ncbi:hypothetical protein LUZ63_020161 [Rhynchospora breviuscula]|uniref:HTH luxR-type domain-containing protein n=1 Tax=Rhynchospora breviuscula TaxID=2022672 RepID=A0A9P9Z8N8_9POAL|nr:hypothetical protein LUZ63_020161 [Rhynchospora breviuscula]
MEGGRRVLLFTEGDRGAMIADAIEAGAQGVVLKSQADGDDLVAAVEAVAEGQLVLSPEVAAVIERDAELRPRLSPRERETLRLLSQGLGDRQIATVMDISQATVKENLKRIRVKYVAHGRPAPTRVDLHQRALEDGYDETTPDEDAPGGDAPAEPGP